MPSDPPDSPDSPPPPEDSAQATAPEAAPPSLVAKISPALHGRLHPLTLLFGILGGWSELRSLFFQLLPMGVVLYASHRQLFLLMLVLLAVYPLFHAAVLYFTFQYGIEEGELVTRQGILKRIERHVPLERVQDLRIEQNLVQQFFGVVAAYVETAGGTGPEASLSVISRTEAERLRRAIFERFPRAIHETEESEEPSRRLIRRLSGSEIILAGLTSNRSASFLIFLLAGWSLLDDLLPEAVYDRLIRGVSEEVQYLSQQGMLMAVLLLVLTVVAILLISLFLSIMGAVFLFYGFTLSLNGEDLHRLYGLLTRRSSSLPRQRIQILEVEEGPLRQLFGLATLRADIAGGAKVTGMAETGRDVLLPVARRNEVEPLLPVFFPDMDADPPEWRRVSKRAILRGTMRGGTFCILVTFWTLWLQKGWVGLWPMAFVPFIYFLNVQAYRRLGYALGPRFFRSRRGLLGRSTHVVPIRNIQSVALHQSVFEYRMGLATLVLDTAGQAFTGGGPRISNLPIEEAEVLARTLAKCASETRYRWESRK
ncbi:MAG: PH domain-containing protein [Armatimonadetes bacterium]|nr:PH domain-containing protein [Armatimonadota bacterium]